MRTRSRGSSLSTPLRCVVDRLKTVGVLADLFDLVLGEDKLLTAIKPALRDVPGFPPSPDRLTRNSEIPLDVRHREICDALDLDRHRRVTLIVASRRDRLHVTRTGAYCNTSYLNVNNISLRLNMSLASRPVTNRTVVSQADRGRTGTESWVHDACNGPRTPGAGEKLGSNFVPVPGGQCQFGPRAVLDPRALKKRRCCGRFYRITRLFGVESPSPAGSTHCIVAFSCDREGQGRGQHAR
jgi:hypothetical protein